MIMEKILPFWDCVILVYLFFIPFTPLLYYYTMILVESLGAMMLSGNDD